MKIIEFYVNAWQWPLCGNLSNNICICSSKVANEQQYFNWIGNCVLYTISIYNKDGLVNFPCFVRCESYKHTRMLHVIIFIIFILEENMLISFIFNFLELNY